MASRSAGGRWDWLVGWLDGVGARRHATRSLLFLILAALAAAAALLGQPAFRSKAAGPTPVCGSLTTATWNAAGSPYQICAGGATIPFGQTITADGAGGPVTVTALGGGGITVSGGTLTTANTTNVNTVTFGASTTWVGITVQQDVSSNKGTLSLTWAAINSVAGNAVYAPSANPISLTDVTITNPTSVGLYMSSTALTLTNSTISGAGGDGLYSAGAALTVSGSTITGSTTFGIEAYPGANAASITNSTISNSVQVGIQVASATNLTLTGNTLTGNGAGATKYAAVYLPGLTGDVGGMTGNVGSNNGFDAIVWYGTQTNSMSWVTPTNSGSNHPLGYMLSSSLTVTSGKTLTVPQGSVVKILSGTITLSGATLDASDTSGGNVTKYFVSWRDNAVGLTTCPSWLVSTGCGAPTFEWGGFYIAQDSGTSVRGVASFYNSQLRDISGNAAYITSGGTTAPLNPGFGLAFNAVTVSTVNGDGVYASPAAVSVVNSTITSPGGTGIESYSSPLTVSGTTITGAGVSGMIVSPGANTASLTNNTVSTAVQLGIQVSSASNLTLTGNTLTGNGAGATKYAAVYLPGLTGDVSAMTGNTGSGNGLDALVFSGTLTNSLNWVTPTNTGVNHPLGYMLSGGITVNSGKTLTFAQGSIVKILSGSITLSGATLDASDTSGGNVTKYFVSWRDNAVGPTTCPTWLVSTSCGAPGNEWSGLSITQDSGTSARGVASIYNAQLRDISGYAAYITSGGTTAPLNPGFGLAFNAVTVSNVSSDGVYASPGAVSVVNSTFTSPGGTGIESYSAPLTVSGTTITGAGGDGILASPGANTASLTNNTVSNAVQVGIQVSSATNLTLTGNTFTGNGAGATKYAAVYLPGLTGDVSAMTGNTGSNNGLDALVFYGTQTNSLGWVTPTNTGSNHPLGYMLGSSLTMNSGTTLTIPQGSVVKILSGNITLSGATLDASDTSGGNVTKYFVSWRDNAVGPTTCPTWLVNNSCGVPGNEWGGISISQDSGTAARGVASVYNAQMRDISGDAAYITSGGTTAPLNPGFGLAFNGVTVSTDNGAPVYASSSAASVVNSTFTSPGGDGIDSFSAALTVSGTTISGSAGYGVLASPSASAVSITNNTVSNSVNVGIQVSSPSNLTLTGNTLTGNGSGTTKYAAIYLPNVTGDVGAMTGNVGSNNGLDAIVFYGTQTNSLNWLTPTNTGSNHPLGYLLSSSLTVNSGKTLTVPEGGIVKILGGSITLSGAILDATDTSSSNAQKVFTTWRDASVGPPTCPTWLVASTCGVTTNDWSGISVIQDSGTAARGAAALTNTSLQHSNSTVIYATSGATTAPGAPGYGVALDGVTLGNSASDGVDAFNTAVSVARSTFSNLGGQGVYVLGGVLASISSSFVTGVGGTSAGNYGLWLGGASGSSTVDCVGIHGNADGIYAPPAGITITSSDLYGNTGPSRFDLNVPSGTTTAQHNWWGQGGGPVAGQLGGAGTVDSSNPLTSQAPTVGIQLSDTNTNTNGNFGTGTMTVTLTFNRHMDTTIQPTVTLNPGAHAITGAWQGDNVTWIGSYAISSSTATNGAGTVNVSGARSCVPDSATNLMSPSSGNLTVDATGNPAATTSAATNPAGCVVDNQSVFNASVNPSGWSTSAYFEYGTSPGTLNQSTTPVGLTTGTTPQAFEQTVTGLTPWTTYYFQVVATGPNGTTRGGIVSIELPPTSAASSTHQYTLPNSDGFTWQELDPSLLESCFSPSTNVTAVLGANADLFTSKAGFNQDLAIFVKVDSGADQLVAWKESGGFAGTFSPNAAYVQATYNMLAGHQYTFKLKWKANKPATGATIWAGAGPISGSYSPTRLNALLVPTTPSTVTDAVITTQPTLANNNGSTWVPIDATNLKTTLTPSVDSIALLGGNADLWTSQAGYNQDIGIFVSDNGAPDQLVAWKESGGFAGTYSPNAAFVQSVYNMTATHTYVFTLKWKTNKNAPGATIWAGAGPISGQYSPTRLTTVTYPQGANPAVTDSSTTSQYTLPNSDGSTWQPVDANPGNLSITITPSATQTAILGANVDLWTSQAGYNQDIAIMVQVDGGAAQLVMWKESGGFAGTFSPNAAYAGTTYQLNTGHQYRFFLAWKANKNATGATIWAGAGPISGQYSPTRLTMVLAN